MKLLNLVLLFVSAVCLTMSLKADSTKVFPSYKLVSKGEEDQWHPVVGIQEKKPLILTKSGLEEAKTGWAKPEKAMAVNDLWIEYFSVEQVDNPNNIVLDVKFQSSDALSDAYAVLIYPASNEKGDKWMGSHMASMPDLTGEPQQVQLWFPKWNVTEGEWDLHVYQTGVELYDKNRSDLKDASPQDAYSLHFRRHIFATGTGDARPAPFYMPVKTPDPELIPDTAGPFIVKVKITIGRNGRITSHEYVGDVSKKLQKHISASIDQWLFFPEIKQGQLMERTVVVPLQMR